MQQYSLQNFKTVFNLLKETQEVSSEYFHALTEQDSNFSSNGVLSHGYLNHLIKDGLVKQVINGTEFAAVGYGGKGSSTNLKNNTYAYQLTEKGRECDFDAYLNELRACKKFCVSGNF